jgi:hypothetical protein
LSVCYAVEGDIVKCVLADNQGVKYVDIVKKKEVPFTTLKVTLEDAGADDTNKLIYTSNLNEAQSAHQTNEEVFTYAVEKKPKKRSATKKPK